MRLSDYLDKGASLGPSSPCLTMGDRGPCPTTRCNGWRGDRPGVAPVGGEAGGKVAILSANDPIAFTCVFGIALAGAVWCPINPRNEAAENRDLLDAFDCTCLIYQQAFAPLVDQILPALPKLRTVVCLDGSRPGSPSLQEWLDGASRRPPGRPDARVAGIACGRLDALPERTRRPGDDRRHRRHHRPTQGRDADRPEPGDDDGVDPDGLSVSRTAGVSRARSADPRRRGAVLSGAGQAAARS